MKQNSISLIRMYMVAFVMCFQQKTNSIIIDIKKILGIKKKKRNKPVAVYDANTHKPLDGATYTRKMAMMEAAYVLDTSHPVFKKAEFFVMAINRIPKKTEQTGLATNNQTGYFEDMIVLHNEEFDMEVTLPRRNLFKLFKQK